MNTMIGKGGVMCIETHTHTVLKNDEKIFLLRQMFSKRRQTTFVTFFQDTYL